MRHRWAIFAMGIWIAGTFMTSVVATENFYTVDRLLDGSTSPGFTSKVEQLGRPQARELLRYLSSELNRRYFALWNAAQLVLGFAILWLIAQVPGAAAARWAVVGMLGVVLLTLVWLTPEITSLGRTLDFVPRDPAPPGLNRFWILHAAYTMLALCNLIMGIVVTIWIERSVKKEEVADRKKQVLSPWSLVLGRTKHEDQELRTKN